MDSENEVFETPPKSVQAKENELIALAVDLAEKQLREGTASAQVISHYLKLGSSRERLEKENLRKRNEMLEEKTKTLQSMQHVEELYSQAMAAMKKYSGQ